MGAKFKTGDIVFVEEAKGFGKILNIEKDKSVVVQLDNEPEGNTWLCEFADLSPTVRIGNQLRVLACDRMHIG
jgi:hypothetical protein